MKSSWKIQQGDSGQTREGTPELGLTRSRKRDTVPGASHSALVALCFALRDEDRQKVATRNKHEEKVQAFSVPAQLLRLSRRTAAQGGEE
jgi:hypothetical protein